jgi:2-polyprenyl-3-methyl-5-hydroxy-6-metoxy-1,4-benzoquinol methylase
MDKEFQYKEEDEVGLETLDVISSAGKFNRWMYEKIAPYCSGDILEIGSGTGNISEHFLKENASITLSDIRINYCSHLENKFQKFPNLKEVVLLNLVDPLFDAKFEKYLGKFDTVFSLNVMEHIKDHDLAIRNCRKLLKPAGKIIILVPAYSFLYNKLDEELYHFRRYNLPMLRALVAANDFKIKKGFYFNFAGIPGWFVSGKMQRNKSIPKGQIKLYNKLVPLFRVIDKILFNRTGLSVIVVGEK